MLLSLYLNKTKTKSKSKTKQIDSWRASSTAICIAIALRLSSRTHSRILNITTRARSFYRATPWTTSSTASTASWWCSCRARTSGRRRAKSCAPPLRGAKYTFFFSTPIDERERERFAILYFVVRIQLIVFMSMLLQLSAGAAKRPSAAAAVVVAVKRVARQARARGTIHRTTREREEIIVFFLLTNLWFFFFCCDTHVFSSFFFLSCFQTVCSI